MSYLRMISVIVVFAFGIGCGNKKAEQNPVSSVGDPTGMPPVIGDSITTPPAEEVPVTSAFRLAFVSGEKFRAFDIFLLKDDGSAPINLTQSPTQLVIGLTWSPDGSKLAFVSSDDQFGEESDIFVLDVVGDSRTKLTGQQARYGSLSWSPDGTRLAFSYQHHIYVMNNDGSDMKALTDLFNSESDFDSNPAWSPDGNRIAFFRYMAINRDVTTGVIDFVIDIYEMNADGSHLTRLTEESFTGFTYALSWSPDGNYLVFTHQEFGSDQELYLLEVGGGYPINLTNNPTGNDSNPVWSPDGSQIAFASSGIGIQVVGVDGTGPVNLVPTSGSGIDFPQWSSDGKKIAYVSVGTDLDIYVVDVYGDSPLNLTDQISISTRNMVFATGYLAWAP